MLEPDLMRLEHSRQASQVPNAHGRQEKEL